MVNPKVAEGDKKPQLQLIPLAALEAAAGALSDGCRKYGPANWRTTGVSKSVYVGAALRHITAYYEGEEVAEDSGVHHLGHAIACLAILLDGNKYEVMEP